jgi:uncharacterized protein (DUF4415 family)
MSEPTLMSADTSTTDAASQTPAAETPAVEATEQQQAAETPVVEGEQEQTEAAEAEDTPQGAPEAYEDFTVPDGVVLDAEVTEQFKAVAKELNLPQEAAQKVTDLGVQLAQKWAEESAARIAEMQTGWRNETQADREIGGDTLPQTLSVAKAAVDKFGTPALGELLEQSGLGNHPEIIRFCARVGKAVSEDTFVAGGVTTPKKSHAQVLFPDMKH